MSQDRKDPPLHDDKKTSQDKPEDPREREKRKQHESENQDQDARCDDEGTRTHQRCRGALPPPAV